MQEKFENGNCASVIWPWLDQSGANCFHHSVSFSTALHV